MGKKASVKPAQQVMNVNLVNRFGAASASNGLDTINFSSIKCHVCGRTRPVDCYSNRQILKHQNTVYNPYIPGGRSTKDYATCKSCTAAQVETIHCFICNLEKPIESFLKTQRSQARPRCKGCVQYCLDTERHGETPNLDNYHEDSSDESSIDGESVDGDSAPEDSDGDVDAPPKAEKSVPGSVTSSVARQMASMSLLDTSSGSEGRTTPILQGRGTATPGSSASTALKNNPDNDVNGSEDGAWETVGVAGKVNSAYRTPSYASRAASGLATPATAGTASYSATTRTTKSPTTAATTVSYTSTGRMKWGKPAKLKPGAVVEDVWVSEAAKRNNWNAFGGQPKLVKTKNRARRTSDDDDDEDEYDE